MHDVIALGLLDMWNEGPGGGHYENIKSTKFTQIGCGVFVAANGDVTVTMDTPTKSIYRNRSNEFSENRKTGRQENGKNSFVG